MKVALYLNVVSPHQLPLAREVVRIIGEENFKYVYAEDFLVDRKNMGWDEGDVPHWCVKGDEDTPELMDAELVYTGIRCIELIAKRAALGKMTVYYSERWFKPNVGVFRLLSLSYLKMAWRFVELLRTGKWLTFYPVGIHAARDMARLCGLFAGDLRCLFRAPKLDFERRPGGRIYIREQGIGNGEQNKKYCLDKMRMWGYFVEPSTTHSSTPPLPHSPTLKVLWVGRLLKLKRVDTIIRAVGELATNSISDNLHSPTPTPNSNSNSPTHQLTHSQFSLDIYGTGPEESRLKKLAAKYGDCIKFYPPVPIDEVRKLMREHDIYVLSSNAYEGWGAVVSEALEEGMQVIGTYEAGSSATILPRAKLFHAWDWRRLQEILTSKDVVLTSIGEWNAKRAAVFITAFVGASDE